MGNNRTTSAIYHIENHGARKISRKRRGKTEGSRSRRVTVFLSPPQARGSAFSSKTLFSRRGTVNEKPLRFVAQRMRRVKPRPDSDESAPARPPGVAFRTGPNAPRRLGGTFRREPAIAVGTGAMSAQNRAFRDVLLRGRRGPADDRRNSPDNVFGIPGRCEVRGLAGTASAKMPLPRRLANGPFASRRPGGPFADEPASPPAGQTVRALRNGIGSGGGARRWVDDRTRSKVARAVERVRLGRGNAGRSPGGRPHSPGSAALARRVWGRLGPKLRRLARAFN